MGFVELNFFTIKATKKKNHEFSRRGLHAHFLYHLSSSLSSSYHVCNPVARSATFCKGVARTLTYCVSALYNRKNMSVQPPMQKTPEKNISCPKSAYSNCKRHLFLTHVILRKNTIENVCKDILKIASVFILQKQKMITFASEKSIAI